MPFSSSVLVSQIIRFTSLLTVFLKLGQMDFSKASNSISHHPTSIFPKKNDAGAENAENYQKCKKSPKMSKKNTPKMPKFTKRKQK